MPNGPTFVTENSQLGVRNTQERTDVDFHEGPNVMGIMHRFQANNRGIIGDDVSSFPTLSDQIRIPHRLAFRTGVGQGARPRGNPVLADETAYVPAWAVGDPR